jgi:ribonucleoside-diphosphate reductase alpha chain
LAAKFPKIDFSKITRYESEDLTKAAQELACMGGACEVDFDVTKGLSQIVSTAAE